MGEIVDSYILFERDQDIRELLQTFNLEFEANFKRAYQFYIDGQWGRAVDILNYCLTLDPKDGPALTLKEFILSENSVAPRNWPGYRFLSEK